MVRCILSCVVLVAAGCGTGGPTAERASVEGAVYWNGEAVSDGVVTFIPSAKNPGMSSDSIPARVEDGQYTLAETDGLFAGPYRVEVRAFRKTGKKSPEPTEAMKRFDPTLQSVELKEQVIPAEFNESSTLTGEVEAGPNLLDFDLKGRETHSSNLRPGRK